MKKLILLLVLAQPFFVSFGQCTFTGVPLTQAGNEISFCIDSTNNQSVASANAGQFVLVNVVKGFSYSFTVGDVFVAADENLTVLNATTNASISGAFQSSSSGAVLNWVATLSGQVKLLLSKGNCINDGTTGGLVTLSLTAIGNTQDDSTSYGTDNWIGHIYNILGAMPPGGSTSPAAPAATTPFSSAEYAGYYTVPTETITENFGGAANCFTVFSNGVNATSIYTESFAVRYRMQSTKTGCYLVSLKVDDGMRLYVDGNLVFSSWFNLSSTEYANVLVYLSGTSNLVLDYFENSSGNTCNFSMVPFNDTSNVITASATAICGVNTTTLDGSSYVYDGVIANPSLTFQWQSSSDNTNFTTIFGATSEDLTPALQTVLNNSVVSYYRRIVKAVAASASSCQLYSNSIKVTTSLSAPTAVTALVGLETVTPAQSALIYTAIGGTDGVTYYWTVPSGWTITGGQGTVALQATSGANGQNGFISVTVTNGCGSNATFQKPVTVNTTTVTWNGSTWSGTPMASTNLIFNGNYSANADLEGYTCVVNSGFIVTIPSGSSMTIQDFVHVDGTGSLTFENNAPLVQINQNAINVGNVTVKRNSSALMRLDYTLWSSPVVAQNMLTFSPFTLNIGPSNIRFYTYNTNMNYYDKIVDAGTTNFAPGAGYLIRMPNNHPTTPTVWNGNFNGIPNNGTLNVPITYTSATQYYNSVGNPYPSPISLARFLAENTAIISPALYFWRKTNSTTANSAYSTWNNGVFTSGTGLATSDDPLGVLQTGQGFIVGAKPGVNNVVFTNAMRITDKNNQFFKGASSTASTDALNFIWLNLTGDLNLFCQLALGYRTNATNGLDDFDATRIDGQFTLNSLIAGSTSDFVIQSRAVPFSQSDAVPLSMKAPNDGTYTITLDHTLGLFSSGQQIILKDKLLNTLNDLTTSSYTFTGKAGYVTDRFEIVYQSALSVDSSNYKNELVLYKNNSNLVINAGTEIITSVSIMDLNGRLLLKKSDLKMSEVVLPMLFENQVFLVKTTLASGKIITKKYLN